MLGIDALRELGILNRAVSYHVPSATKLIMQADSLLSRRSSRKNRYNPFLSKSYPFVTIHFVFLNRLHKLTEAEK